MKCAVWNNSSQSEHTWYLIYSYVQHSLDQWDFSMGGATQCDTAGRETEQLTKYHLWLHLTITIYISLFFTFRNAGNISDAQLIIIKNSLWSCLVACLLKNADCKRSEGHRCSVNRPSNATFLLLLIAHCHPPSRAWRSQTGRATLFLSDMRSFLNSPVITAMI